MTIPQWVLLGFAMWTLLVLGATIGVYRWGHILSRRAKFADYGEYRIEGRGWYSRSMRAHANCIENLPVFASIVFIATIASAKGGVMDTLAIAFAIGRVCQTFVHVSFPQTNVVVGFRSLFYNAQWLCMIVMGGLAARAALSGT
jgi:uncharacterized MAPEG superfamily protein